MKKAFKYVPSSAELQPADVVRLFRESTSADWLRDEDDPDAPGLALRTNLLVSLWPRRDGRFDLRYGYQPVAIVAAPSGGASVELLDLAVQPVG